MKHSKLLNIQWMSLERCGDVLRSFGSFVVFFFSGRSLRAVLVPRYWKGWDINEAKGLEKREGWTNLWFESIPFFWFKVFFILGIEYSSSESFGGSWT